MLLALIRDKYYEFGDAAAGDGPHYLIWGGPYRQGDEEFKFRSGDQNWRVLRDFILLKPGEPGRKVLTKRKDYDSLDATEKAANRRMLSGYQRLRKSLEDNIGLDAEPAKALASLEERLVKHVELVVIEVTDLEDAFLLFETLNDRGLELSAADLLKSHLLSRLATKTRSDVAILSKASDDWDKLVEVLGGGDITGFLRYFLLMTHKRVQKKDIFPFFKSDVAHAGPERLLDELLTMGRVYAQLLEPPSDDSALEVLLNLQQTHVDTHRVALLPARRWLDDDQFIEFARLTEVLSFRWTVVGANAQELETLYQEVAETLQRSEGSQVMEAMELIRARYPHPDSAFRLGFRSMHLGRTDVASYMLRKIENALAPSSEKEIRPRSEVHVEHIMPVTATSCTGRSESQMSLCTLTLLVDGEI